MPSSAGLFYNRVSCLLSVFLAGGYQDRAYDSAFTEITAANDGRTPRFQYKCSVVCFYESMYSICLVLFHVTLGRAY